MNNIKHPKKALTAATAKSKKPAPTHTVAPGINVSDKVYSFPGRDLLAVRITSEGAILDALNRAISEEYRQLSNDISHGGTAPARVSEVLYRALGIFPSSNRDVIQCLQMATAWCNTIDESRGKLAKEYATAVCKPSQKFLNTELKDAMHSLAEYDRQVQDVSRVSVQHSKNPDKVQKQTLQEMEQQTKQMGTRTLALLVDTEERLELVLMEQILAYMTTYKAYLEESLRKMNSHISQIAQFQQLYERKFVGYERGDNTAIITNAPLNRKKIFGVSLTDLAEREGAEFPKFLNEALSFLEENSAYEFEGIFRISGSKKDMENWVNETNQTGEIDFGLFATSIHNVTGIIKMWLRDLPKTIFSWDDVDALVQLSGMHCDTCQLTRSDLSSSERRRGSKLILEKLPKTHRQCLKILVAFFHKITKHVEHSKMDAINIATVVGPNLVPLVEMLDPYEYLQNNAKIHAVLVYLISNYEGVFLESDTTKDTPARDEYIATRSRSSKVTPEKWDESDQAEDGSSDAEATPHDTERESSWARVSPGAHPRKETPHAEIASADSCIPEPIPPDQSSSEQDLAPQNSYRKSSQSCSPEPSTQAIQIREKEMHQQEAELAEELTSSSANTHESKAQIQESEEQSDTRTPETPDRVDQLPEETSSEPEKDPENEQPHQEQKYKKQDHDQEEQEQSQPQQKLPKRPEVKPRQQVLKRPAIYRPPPVTSSSDEGRASNTSSATNGE